MGFATTDDLLLPDLITETANRQPDSVALTDGRKRLSYETLDRSANQFAFYLALNGIGTGQSVAICMERSFEWIIAALGIMRSGASYVPLDPKWPDSRVQFAVDDSGAAAVVASASTLGRLRRKPFGVDPSRDARAIACAPRAAREPVDGTSLAYIIYTSGSTGTPKGVEITHANLAHLIRWHRQAFDVQRQDRVSHLAGLGFDAAVWEIWPNLCGGATLCLADDSVRSSPELLQQWLISRQITIAFVPTLHAAPMLKMSWPRETALRFLLTGGDALRVGPGDGLPFSVVNNYGPTECTVVATSALLKAGVSGEPSIGSPIAGATVYVLDEDGQQVPDGCSGEICIGGNGVGRGYHNLDDSVQRNFLPDPFAASPDGRMFRTGDRGIRRPDGEIGFLGRMDRQTKIRGQRVELDEIENILVRHPAIEFAAVATSRSADGECQIVAHVLPGKCSRVPGAKELRQYLLRSLPDYMVPSAFLRLESVPLSENGKIDRSRLEQAGGAALPVDIHRKLPGTAVEWKLLAIVHRILDTDAIGIDENFFLAGGHSLLGMQLLMRLRTTFGVELTLKELFAAPTVEKMASMIETKQQEMRLAEIWAELLGQKYIGPEENLFNLGAHPAVFSALQGRVAMEFGRKVTVAQLFQNPTVRSQVTLMLNAAKHERVIPPGVLPLRQNGSRPTIFWVHYLNVKLAKEVGEDQPVCLVMLTKADMALLGQKPTLASIAACFIRKILATQPNGPYHIAGLCIGGVLAYEIATQLRAAGHEVSLLVLLDAPSPAYLNSYNSLAAKLNRPRHRIERMLRLGLRESLFNFRRRLLKYAARTAGARSAWSQFSEAQALIESAAFGYKAEGYEGDVLLLLASRRTASLDFLPGWQALIRNNLHTKFVEGHHRELMTTAQNVRSVAEIILSYLAPPNEPQQNLAV